MAQGRCRMNAAFRCSVQACPALLRLRWRDWTVASFLKQLQKNPFLQGYASQLWNNLPQVVLLLESSRGAGRALLRGFANYARHHGPWTFHWEPGGLNEIWPRLNRLNAQGIFLRDGKHIRKVLALGVPTVVVGHRKEDFPGVAHVVTDSESAGRLAAEHLLGCGFKNFAFCGPSHIRWSAARRESFQQRLQQVRPARSIFLMPRPRAAKFPGARNIWAWAAG